MKYIFGVIGLFVLAFGAWNVGDEKRNLPSEEIKTAELTALEVDELEEYVVADIDYVDAATLVSLESGSTLTQAEIDGLTFMREEEKLARDVYLALYDVWGVTIFSTIAGSEVTHMDAVGTLLEKYGITDPASKERGVFTNETLQALYDALVADGTQSRAAAFTVGAKIEDLDIRDLENNLAVTNNADVIAVYESLQRGSRNHLRAFNRQIRNETGSDYKPEFISNADFAAIIASDVERGAATGQGTNVGSGQGTGRGRN